MHSMNTGKNIRDHDPFILDFESSPQAYFFEAMVKKRPAAAEGPPDPDPTSPNREAQAEEEKDQEKSEKEEQPEEEKDSPEKTSRPKAKAKAKPKAKGKAKGKASAKTKKKTEKDNKGKDKTKKEEEKPEKAKPETLQEKTEKWKHALKKSDEDKGEEEASEGCLYVDIYFFKKNLFPFIGVLYKESQVHGWPRNLSSIFSPRYSVLKILWILSSIVP